MKLLICTQTVDIKDSNLGFFVCWIQEFAKYCEKVTVICLREGTHALPDNVEVIALGTTRTGRAIGLLRVCIARRHTYDSVFVHMNPEYIVVAGILWRLMHKKITLWYVHKSVNLKLRAAVSFAHNVFTASSESFRLRSNKVRVMGHGIDTEFFSPDSNVVRGDWMLSVGRLMPSKRHDLAIRTALREGKELRIAGEGPERERLEALTRELGARVQFLGGIRQLQLRDEYRKAACLIHTSETGSLDKVVLEALACGLKVRTNDPALKPLESEDSRYVRDHHSLQRLIPALLNAMQHILNPMLRILFLFTNSREEVIFRMQAGHDADTALHGMNHLPNAEHLTVPPQSVRALWFVPRLFHYDFVIAQDNLLLGYIVSQCARIFRLKTRWLYIAMTSSTLMRRHAAHPIRLALLKRFWASYTRIICISSEQIEDFMRLGIPRERLVFVPFGVDIQFFKPSCVSSEEDIVVSVGRDAGRDYTTLFKAATCAEHSFVIVASKRNIPSDKPIPVNVSVLYDRPLTEVRELYARARFIVVPSKDITVPDGSDCSGQTVILDALAAGKAVIATNRAWITDYFIPGQDLVVVPPNDPKALVQAVDLLWHDTEKRKRIAASGHAKVVAHYTTKTFAEALRRLMNSLI